MKKFKTIVRRISYVLLMSFIYLTAIPKLANTENLVITTYYPAPYGGYVSLLTTNNTWLARDAGSVGVGTLNPRAQLDATQGAVFNQIAIGANSNPFGSQSYPYESIQLPNWANLRFNFGSSERAVLRNNGSLQLANRLGTQGFDADSGYPDGWGGGIHTWDVYSEGSIATGRWGGIGWVVNSSGYMWFSPTGRIDGLCRWQWKGPGWGSCNPGEVLVTTNWTGFDSEFACVGNANFMYGIGNVCLFGYKSVPVSGYMLCCRIA
jgi:hypothetical protein